MVLGIFESVDGLDRRRRSVLHNGKGPRSATSKMARWTMKYKKQHIAAGIFTILAVAYIFYLRVPSSDWRDPRPETLEIQAGERFRVYFKVQSLRDCVLTITRYAERTLPNGTIQILPPLLTDKKVIKEKPGWRDSFFEVQFPVGTEPATYQVFSRIHSDCNWLDRVWPRVNDTPSAIITVVP